MNGKFNHALYLLDKGEYDKAEICLRDAISESDNAFEVIQIRCCYAELLMEQERYSEAMENVEYILSNTDEYSDNSQERATAQEIKDYIQSEGLI
ncbi:MAG: hypothetical protein E7478_07910 [Ruminococcaceae bacterium]|nr:hypothetical protein [Oscillospiraceae bacterium]